MIIPISITITAITPNQIGSKPIAVTIREEDRDRDDQHGEPVEEHAEQASDDDHRQHAVGAEARLTGEAGRWVSAREWVQHVRADHDQEQHRGGAHGVGGASP
ncbi:MAG: hypothetical protein R3D59_09195 [Paracoccaceae bacterium]